MGKKLKKRTKVDRDAPTLVKASQAEIVEIDEVLVSDAVKWINDRAAKTVEKGMQGLLEIGQYVFERFFDSKTENVQFRGRQKANSFRVLSNHADLQIARTSLHNAVNLAVQEQSLIAAGVPSNGISVSHKVVLLPVHEIKEKKRLLAEASEKGLSVRQLHDRVAEAIGKLLPPADGDGKAKKVEFRMPRAIAQVIDLDTEKWLSEKRLSRLKPTHIERYRDAITKAVERLQEMQRVLGKVARQVAAN